MDFTLDRIGGPQDLFYARANTQSLPTIVRGDGIYVWDDAGNRYIDVSSGPVVSNIGHGNPRILEAMTAQNKQLTFTYTRVSRHYPNVALAERIAGLSGPGFERVHFSSSGSEAVEQALKFLRQYAFAKGQLKKSQIISLFPSYHGGTLGTLAITGDMDIEKVYGDMAVFSTKINAPLTYRLGDGETVDSMARKAARQLDDAVLRLGPESTLAFVVEPIGGLATGCNVLPDAYVREVRRICTKYDVYLVFDEVMSGCGRSGKFLTAHYWPAALPDIVVLAKGLGAGYTPLAAMLAPARMVDELAASTGFNLAHTYNANPISCAGGCAVLDEVVERGLIENAANMGARLNRALNDLKEEVPIIGDVRGLGLLCAVEIVMNQRTKAKLPLAAMAADRIRQIGQQHGLMIYTRRTNGGRLGEWFMVSPPLIVTKEDVDEIVHRLKATLMEFCLEIQPGLAADA